MTITATRCLILACGNTLRGDDRLGPWLAQWAEERFQADQDVRILSCQQWTPELAEDIAQAESVLFIDASVDSLPGSVNLIPVHPASSTQSLATHHLGAEELLALSRDLYSAAPASAVLLTVGAASTELGADFSEPVIAALPRAFALLEKTVLGLLANHKERSHRT
jgi:hydrogenase maturation protease